MLKQLLRNWLGIQELSNSIAKLKKSDKYKGRDWSSTDDMWPDSGQTAVPTPSAPEQEERAPTTVQFSREKIVKGYEK